MISVDKVQGVIWIDGKFVDWQECKLHIATHALHYGGAVFEGIRIYNTKPFKLNEHNQRLVQSAKLLGYTIPYTSCELNDAVIATIKKQNLSSGYVRVLAWRGSEEQQISGTHCTIHVAIMAWDAFGEKSRYHDSGVKLEIARWIKPPVSAAPVQSKAAGLYMMGTVIQNEARSRGFDDALVLDQDGYITEATTSNFFMIKDDILYTPTPDCFLDGITRQTVLEIAAELQIPNKVQKLKVNDLAGADGAFLTGTALEITPIALINDERTNTVYTMSPSPIMQRIRERYSEST
jgi:branched-chain amino acid aminotransferase